MKFGSIIFGLLLFLIGILLLAIVIGLCLLIFGKQEIEYSTSSNCGELRECILLEYSCLDVFVLNKIVGIEWSYERESLFNEQKEFYIKECVIQEKSE